jgi:hypothetical protein
MQSLPRNVSPQLAFFIAQSRESLLLAKKWQKKRGVAGHGR